MLRFTASLLISLWLLTPFSQLTRASTIPTISSISTDVVSFSDADSSVVTFAVYGTDLGDAINGTQTIWFGDFQATVVGGNATAVTLSFTLTPSDIPTGFYPLVVKEADTTIYTSESIVDVINMFDIDPDLPSVTHYLKHAPTKRVSKKRLGLNVHYALGSSADEDATVETRLLNSKTRWMREHFSDAVLMGSDQAAWFKRYDKAMQFAADHHIRVVGMLAYGPTDGDFSRPHKADWQAFVELVVNRYKNVVDVWEVWNEPDSADYLDPATFQNYKHLLDQAVPIIRTQDPTAKILGGALSTLNATWAKQLFTQAGDDFDALSVHVYDCEDWLETKNYENLDADWQALQKVVHQYTPDEKIWITELGCSMGSHGVGQHQQRSALKHITNHLFHTGSVAVAFLYTIRDRSYLISSDQYEAYFGLLHSDFSPKLAWRWYRKIKLKT